MLFGNIQGCYLMQFYQLATICFVTSRKKMQSTLICSLDCDANNIFVWVGDGGGLMPSPQRGEGRVSGRFLATTVVLLRRIHLIQIATGFRRRVAGGEGRVDIPRRHAVDDVRGLHFVI